MWCLVGPPVGPGLLHVPPIGGFHLLVLGAGWGGVGFTSQGWQHPWPLQVLAALTPLVTRTRNVSGSYQVYLLASFEPLCEVRARSRTARPPAVLYASLSSPPSSITIAKVVREPRKTTVQREAPEDDGFRLFFTSIPGDTGKAAEPQPRRKRQPSSSSSEDSDEEWQRCQEAAVSASDILQESAIHSPVQQEEEEEEARKKKKKKKLKKKAQKVADVDSAVTTATTGAMVQKQEEGLGKANGAHAALGTKKKRKKKARKAHEAAPLSPAASPEATPAH
ncbi:protein CUSTOS isoform X2 [Ochotona princeps]|uniref:protein CUSTOS isoform X2 n=1 Tax=Ochotona princeps TaxID=9978 RepID=UPI0027146060|nr:protein CUSTOS isoform X2 [Ochotona princeps]